MTIRLSALALAMFACSAAALAQPSACPQFFPGGQPPALTNPRLAQRTTLLCNDGYAALASGVTHGAIWSAERLTAASLAAARGIPRQGAFHPDIRLPRTDQAQLDDYRRSGYDRGHMAPSGDMPDERAQEQSFALSNMVPQTAALNRGVWEGIELEHRVTAKVVGVVAVLVACRDHQHARADDLVQAMDHPAGIARITDAARQARGDSKPLLDLTQRQQSAIGRHAGRIKARLDRLAADR